MLYGFNADDGVGLSFIYTNIFIFKPIIVFYVFSGELQVSSTGVLSKKTKLIFEKAA
jgi:hypothetical protein